MENAVLTGWVQIFAVGGLIDFFNLQTEPIKYPGDYELFGTFGMTDEGSIADIGSHHCEIRIQYEVTADASSGQATYCASPFKAQF